MVSAELSAIGTKARLGTLTLHGVGEGELVAHHRAGVSAVDHDGVPRVLRSYVLPITKLFFSSSQLASNVTKVGRSASAHERRFVR